MQQIERYGVIALVFLLVTIVAVSFWGDSKSPGFWSRLTGRGAKKDAPSAQTVDAAAPGGSTVERAIGDPLPLSSPGAVAPSTPVTAAAENAPAPQPLMAIPAATPTVVLAPTSTPPAAARPASRVAPPAERVAAGSSEYVVQKGDSLIQIATRMLGSKTRWTEIRDLNPGVDPRSLKVGTKLAIPASAKATKQPGASAPVQKPATAPAVKASGSGSGTYVVRKGDTLKSISEKLLGGSGNWKQLAAANPGVDPHHISVGTSLRLPGGGHAASHASEPLVAAAMPAPASDRPHVR